jgi:hypothetical protein
LIKCHRCLKLISTKTAQSIDHVCLGPLCYQIVMKRCRLRGMGADSKLISNPYNSKSVFYTSDLSLRICPDSSIHCIECIYHRDRKCPLEKYIEDSHVS